MMALLHLIVLLLLSVQSSYEHPTKQKRDRFIDFLRSQIEEPVDTQPDRRKWTDVDMRGRYLLKDEDLDEIESDIDGFEQNYLNQQKPHSSEWQFETTSLPTTTPVKNDTQEILNWFQKQLDLQEVNTKNKFKITSRDYGYCFAYINASTLESLHGLQEDNRMNTMLSNDLAKSCQNPCISYNRSQTFNSTPISQKSCGSQILINIGNEGIYNQSCEPQLRVLLDQPIFISHQLHWCVYMDIAFEHHDIPKTLIKGEDEDEDERLVFPHRGNRFHDQWSPMNEFCPDIDIRIDGKFFCEINDDEMVPESKFIYEFDEEMKELFVNEMLNNVIDRDRILNHYHFQHCDAFAFFYGHRRFLSCVKNILAKKSIPLPMWSPEIEPTIPKLLQGVKYSPYACLRSTHCVEGWLDIPLQVTTIDARRPIELTPEHICKQDFFSLHTTTMEFHRIVHNTISGTFRTFDSPATLLFYAFHNYIDKEIFGRWERCSEENFLFGKRNGASS